MISIDDLKLEIKDYNYRILTGDSDVPAERAIAKATSWITAKSKVQGVPVDFDDEVVNEILLKRALYELYSFADNEAIARDKKEDAYELLKGYWKNSASLDGSGYEMGSVGDFPKPVVAVIKPPAKTVKRWGE